MSKKINPEKYTRSQAIFEDGDWWYYSPSGYRQRVETHAAKNKNRMYVNGRYVPSSHPLHRPGRYQSLDDAWSHEKIESTKEGEVYAITNPAWPEWIKIGKAVRADDRLNGYQTSSPHRDYEILARISVDNRHEKELEMHKRFEDNASDRKGEWFKTDESTAILLFLEETDVTSKDNS